MHKVVNGDSLASLADRYLGSGSRAMELPASPRPNCKRPSAKLRLCKKLPTPNRRPLTP
jgi:hypothetical protein